MDHYVLNARRDEEATSQTVGVLLMVAIVVLLAILILLIFRLPPLDWEHPLDPPPVIEILSVLHANEQGTVLNYDSRVILAHTGNEPYENACLAAEIFVNGNAAACRISTMNGHLFISTHHFGVERMWGTGCQTNWWNPREKIGLDLADGTIHPGDEVRVDVIETASDTVISRHTIVA